MKLLLLSFLLVSLIARADLSVPKATAMVSLTLDDYSYGMTIINSYGMDIAGVDYDNKIVDLIVTSEDLKILEDYGLFNAKKRFDRMGMKGDGFSDKDYDWAGYYSSFIPPDAGYKTPEEVEAILKEYSEKYPHITRLEVIGQSLEGRNIYAMKISDNPNERELKEPTILFNSVHHARELMTPEVALDVIDQLVKGYMRKIDITRWVKGSEIWVIPMVNPDGNNKVWTKDTWWRKNTRGGYGVDLNRNYPFNWNTCNGSSASTYSQTYRGEGPGSEPETNVIMDLVARIRPVFDISYHSYSELVLYPFGCSGERADDMVVSIGQKLGELLEYQAGTPWEILYNADGGDIDWMYGEYQVIPYVIELNSRKEGFQPSYAKWRDVTVEKNRAGWKYLLKRLFGSGLRGIAQNKAGEIVDEFMVKVEKKTEGNYQHVMNYRGNPDGTFHIVLDPGNYRFTFEAEGLESVVKKRRIWGWLSRYNPSF